MNTGLPLPWQVVKSGNSHVTYWGIRSGDDYVVDMGSISQDVADYAVRAANLHPKLARFIRLGGSCQCSMLPDQGFCEYCNERATLLREADC